MKTFSVLVAMTALYGASATAQANSTTTITCSSGCPTIASTPDIVTRTPLPSSSPCTAASVAIISTGNGGAAATSAGSAPTQSIVAAGADRVNSGIAGFLAIAAGALVINI